MYDDAAFMLSLIFDTLMMLLSPFRQSPLWFCCHYLLFHLFYFHYYFLIFIFRHYFRHLLSLHYATFHALMSLCRSTPRVCRLRRRCLIRAAPAATFNHAVIDDTSFSCTVRCRLLLRTLRLFPLSP